MRRRQHTPVRRDNLDRDAGELGEELRVVLAVGRVQAGIAPGSNPRATAERLDLDAGIVSERRQSRCPCGEAGLDPGVGLERQAVLDRVALDAELLERDEVQIVDALEGQQLAELAQLVGRPRRDDEPAPGPSECAQRRTVASAAA